MGGGRAQIYWNRGDDVKVVAAQFALRNGVGLDARSEIEQFIHTAAGSSPGCSHLQLFATRPLIEWLFVQSRICSSQSQSLLVRQIVQAT